VPTKKQRRRELKSKRHQYEFVYVDADGNELDEPPPELLEQEKQRREKTAAKASPAKNGKQPQRTNRREPQPPSWSRAAKRSLLLGVFFIVILALGAKHNRALVAGEGVVLALAYMPLMYAMDRWIYRRYQTKLASASGATPRPAKKR
jgi:hypothetical protein